MTLFSYIGERIAESSTKRGLVDVFLAVAAGFAQELPRPVVYGIALRGIIAAIIPESKKYDSDDSAPNPQISVSKGNNSIGIQVKQKF